MRQSLLAYPAGGLGTLRCCQRSCAAPPDRHRQHRVSMSSQNEPFVIGRPVEAVMVPAGNTITLQPGVAGYITQALGGSFTLYVEGNLYRLSGENADAVGKQRSVAPEVPPNATEDDVKALAWQQMRGCYDPEIPVN